MGSKPKARGARTRGQQQDVYTLTTLEQVKVLADPLRIRILEAFCEERTTRQVAETLGEKPTKLYHHVDALERVGLITLTRTRQNRGTIEKYFRSVARAFRADSRIFGTADMEKKESRAPIRQMISTVFDRTAAELATLVDQADDVMKAIEERGIVSFIEIRATKKEVKEIRNKLRGLLKSLTTTAELASGSGDAGARERYRLTLAYYPLGSAKRTPRPEES